MITNHQIYFQDSKKMQAINANTVDLVITSPPYPMIEMWDALFSKQNVAIGSALRKESGLEAFELMHRELDATWQEVWRIMKPGGILCVNVGDAARTINRRFMLYPNHARMLGQFLKLGFQPLPAVLWRKQTNAPNKFMGSGMLPPGAYVTLEHEYILILRKGPRREFNTEAQRHNRRESAFFWEERNAWFSDVWTDIKGTAQDLGDRGARRRSAAFPFDVPYRLINMFSVKGDLVVDPFLGMGTTMWAAVTAARNSVSYELEIGLQPEIYASIDQLAAFANTRIQQRIKAHMDYVDQAQCSQNQLKYTNQPYQFAVKTRQETDIYINPLMSIQMNTDTGFDVLYSNETAQLM